MMSFWMAIRLLTCLPAPRSVKPSPGRLVGSMVWFPVVGAGIGAVLGLTEVAVRVVGGYHTLSCAAVVAGGMVLTRGAPLRGLMVLTGALFAGRNREATAQLAARSTPTAFGVLTGVAALLLRYALLLALAGGDRLAALLLAAGLGRTAIVWVCWRFPYAELDTGIGSWFTAAAGPRDLPLALPVIALGFGLLHPLQAASAIAGSWLLAHGHALWTSRVLSGLTAHTCEATAEVGELAALSAMAGWALALQSS